MSLRSTAIGVVALLALALGVALAMAGCSHDAAIEGARCNDAHHCPSGYACLGRRCRALTGQVIVGCVRDEDCPAGACLVSAGFCVQCVLNAQCPASACRGDLHVCGCRKASDCPTGRCNIATATCLSCVSNTQCASGLCEIGTGVCKENSTSH